MPLDLSRAAVLRLDRPDARQFALLRDGGVTAILTPSPDAALAAAAKTAGLACMDSAEVALEDMAGILKAGQAVALRDGIWPGISRGSKPRGDEEVASASREPWVDANGHLAAWLRAIDPERPALLAYGPPADASRAVPFDSLELAWMEARANGGNFLMTLEPGFRDALSRADAKATASWKQLGRTVEWFRSNAALFSGPSFATITVLVEPGDPTAEIANMMYRRLAAPRLVSAARLSKPDPERCLALVAVELQKLPNGIWEHARAGSAVIVVNQAPPGGKHVKAEADRDFYTLGRGRVVSYKGAIADPSEFALDVIDIVTHPRRPIRLWNASAVIARAIHHPEGGAVAVLINYGSPTNHEIQVRIQGHFATAMLHVPESPPRPLPAVRRGSTTEFMLPDMRRLAAVRLL